MHSLVVGQSEPRTRALQWGCQPSTAGLARSAPCQFPHNLADIPACIAIINI